MRTHAATVDRVDIGLDVMVVRWADPTLPPSTIATPAPRNSLGRPIYAAKIVLGELSDADLLEGLERMGRKTYAAHLGIAKETLDNELIRRGLKNRKRRSEITRALAHLSDDELLHAVKVHGTKRCAEMWQVDRSTINTEIRIRHLTHPNRPGA